MVVRTVEYIRLTRERYQELGFPAYSWTVNEASPWAPLSRPLEECRVALLSSGGISLPGQPPFDPGGRDDLSFREIPRDADLSQAVINHNYYDHSDAERDINCIFPTERLRELEEEGYIGELAPLGYTFMGRIFRRRALAEKMAPDLVRRLRESAVDVLLGVPC